jgi:diguanylate cyclase (GGDEF)-like protein
MISLRHYIDHFRTGNTDSALAEFRLTLLAMGESGQRAVPSLNSELSLRLAEIGSELKAPASSESLKNVRERARTELLRWADAALQHQIENERKTIAVVARLAETVGAKDEKFKREISALAQEMLSVAEMNDLSRIRASIVDSTTLLKSCVERMAEEGKASMRRMTGEIESYRTRLEESEKAASVDPLTQLANRRTFEKQLDRLMQEAKPFTLILIDLNDFKEVNDAHGHLAGDDLLRQFAKELRAQFMPADLVSRWGGDEFAAIVPGNSDEAEDRVRRIHGWALGPYKINTGSEIVKITLQASVGVVPWDGRESASDLVDRADKGLYSKKDRVAVRVVPAYES